MHAASGHLLLPFYLTFSSISPILLQKQRKQKYRRNRSLSQKTKGRNAKSQRQGAVKASFPTAADDSRESAAVALAVVVISNKSGPENGIRALKKKYCIKKTSSPSIKIRLPS